MIGVYYKMWIVGFISPFLGVYVISPNAHCGVTWFNLGEVYPVNITKRILQTWWRHQMETFSALLAICARNSPVNSPHKGQWRGALMFSLICAWTNYWANYRVAGDLRRHRAHYYVIVMKSKITFTSQMIIANALSDLGPSWLTAELPANQKRGLEIVVD